MRRRREQLRLVHEKAAEQREAELAGAGKEIKAVSERLEKRGKK